MDCKSAKQRDLSIDPNSNEVVEYVYDPWGRILSTTGFLASTLRVHQPFRYRGYVYDVETGLYYLRSRYYNPTWQKFVSADYYLVINKNKFQDNLFAYCANTPTVYYDPSGHSIQDFFADMFDYWLYRNQRIFWSTVSLALLSANLEYSALLLNNSNRRNPEGLTFESNSELSRKISKDTDFLAQLSDAINQGKNEFSVAFRNDKDLFGAIHKASFEIISVEYNNDRLSYCVELSDEYDFTEFKTDYFQNGLFNAIAWIGNDLAYLSMNVGALNKYPIIIKIEGILP